MVLILFIIIVIENMFFKMRYRVIMFILVLYFVDYILYYFKFNFGIEKKV